MANTSEKHTKLPVITGKPFTPKKTADNSWDNKCNEYVCKDATCTTPNDAMGLHTHRNTVKNGSGWLERKASGEIVYHTPWLKKHHAFKLPEVKPRMETQAKAWVRLQKEFKTDVDRPNCVAVIGQNAGDGYRITATNGHWALCEKAEGAAPKSGLIAATKNHRRIELHNSELHNAVKRASVAADTRTRVVGFVGAGFLMEAGIGVYASQDAYANEVEFSEVVQDKNPGVFHFGVNVDYLEPVFGVWPLALWVHKKEPETYAVMLEPLENPTWRFVLMPYRDRTLKEAQAKFAGYVKEVFGGSQC